MKETLGDAATRSALVERFDLSQTIYQTDPWAELAVREKARAFAPIADLTLEAAQ